jgi:hypothetical protein
VRVGVAQACDHTARHQGHILGHGHTEAADQQHHEHGDVAVFGEDGHQKLKNFQNKYVAIKESPLISKIAHRIGIQTKGSKTYSKLLTNYKNSKQRYAKTKDGMLPESTVRFVKDNALRKMKEKKQLIKKSTSKV